VALPLIRSSPRKYRDLARQLKAVQRNRFHGIELHIDDPRGIDAREIDKLLESFGLELAAIGTGMTYSKFGLSFLDDRSDVRAAAVNRVHEYIRLGSDLNCAVILALIRGRYSAGLGRDRAELILSKTLGEIYRYANNAGTRLLLEPVNRYELNLIHTLSSAAKTVKQSRTPGMKILADTFHMNIEEDSATSAIRSFRPCIGHVHLADCNRGAPGQGHIDFAAILDTLKTSKYKDWVCAEIIFKPDEYEALRQTSSAIHPLL